MKFEKKTSIGFFHKVFTGSSIWFLRSDSLLVQELTTDLPAMNIINENLNQNRVPGLLMQEFDFVLYLRF